MSDNEETLHELHPATEIQKYIGDLLEEGLSTRDPELVHLAMEGSIAFKNHLAVSYRVMKLQIGHQYDCEEEDSK